jgi:hypothetical protein
LVREIATDQFLCCGISPSGTNVWSIRYPAGWKVQLLPDDPNGFYGVIFSEPQGSIEVGFVPGAPTDPNSTMNTSNVDQFLDAYRATRERDNPGFEEFLRQTVPGLPAGRVWAGTWGSGPDRKWAAYLVIVTPFAEVLQGFPKGYLVMMGAESASRDWATAVKLYGNMLNSLKIKSVKTGETAGGESQGEQAAALFLVRWCPKCCDYVAVDGSCKDIACSLCGTQTTPWEVPCTPSPQ